ncbi:unnamed protein product [Phytomonas sp. EM1]|nr:unnamed protein product [Phytomonas sp. EM1]|eukprot:CCW62581.1 unnamed protein product [Phytomonas sp. isolate EM1]
MAYLLSKKETDSDEKQRARPSASISVPTSASSSFLTSGFRSYLSAIIKQQSSSSSPRSRDYCSCPPHPMRVLPKEDAYVNDAELYASVTDFTDIMEILRAPTVPPTKMGFADSPPLSFQRAPIHTPAESSTKGSSSGTSAVRPPCAFGTLTFRRIASNNHTGVEIFSAAVEGCPIHLMRASAIMPCSPADLLKYMDSDIRPAWDSHLRSSRIVRRLKPHPPGAACGGTGPAHAQQTSLIAVLPAEATAPVETSLSHSLSNTRPAPGGLSQTSVVGREHPIDPSKQARCVPPMRPCGVDAEDSFQYRPGQHRVAVHYMEVKSPIPLMQDRDLELLVCEAVTQNGCAVVKAFSTPMGKVVPMDPTQTRYVRAVVLLSGIVAQPLPLGQVDIATSLPPSLRVVAKRDLEDGNSGARKEYCVIEYLGLVHPMGLIPPVITNMVISAQVGVLEGLQRHIAEHPISSSKFGLSPWASIRQSCRESQNGNHFLSARRESPPCVFTDSKNTSAGQASVGLLEDAMGVTPEETRASHGVEESDASHPDREQSPVARPSSQDPLPGGLPSSSASDCKREQNSTVATTTPNQPLTSKDPSVCDGDSGRQRVTSELPLSGSSPSTSTDDAQKKGKVRLWWKHVKKRAMSKL